MQNLRVVMLRPATSRNIGLWYGNNPRAAPLCRLPRPVSLLQLLRLFSRSSLGPLKWPKGPAHSGVHVLFFTDGYGQKADKYQTKRKATNM